MVPMKWLINGAPLALGQLLVDPLQYFSWGIYAGAGVVYTALAFSGELSKKSALVLFRRNAKLPSCIFAIHASFLIILLGVMRAVPLIYLSLPNWMTDLFPHQRPPLSFFDILFVLAMIGLSHVERRWLYEYTDISSSNSGTESERPFDRDEQ